MLAHSDKPRATQLSTFSGEQARSVVHPVIASGWSGLLLLGCGLCGPTVLGSSVCHLPGGILELQGSELLTNPVTLCDIMLHGVLQAAVAREVEQGDLEQEGR